MLRIRKDDVVYVISGKDKGKTGKVIHIYAQEQKALVEHVNVIKKSARKSQQNPQGGFIEREAPIHISNVMLIDKKTNRPARFGASLLKDGEKMRVSKKTKEVI